MTIESFFNYLPSLSASISSFLTKPDFTGWLLAAKIILIVLPSFFLATIIYFLIKTAWIKHRFLFNAVEFLNYQPYGVKKASKQWEKTKKRLEGGLESEYKLAIIEADSMIDEVLKRIGHKGETLGDRLKELTPDLLSNINDIWEAHKIRNNIVHDPDYKLSLREAQKAIEIYEKALTDLGAI